MRGGIPCQGPCMASATELTPGLPRRLRQSQRHCTLFLSLACHQHRHQEAACPQLFPIWTPRSPGPLQLFGLGTLDSKGALCPAVPHSILWRTHQCSAPGGGRIGPQRLGRTHRPSVPAPHTELALLCHHVLHSPHLSPPSQPSSPESLLPATPPLLFHRD